MSVEENLKKVRKKIGECALHCGRDSAEISFVAVTKSATLSQMEEAYKLGLRDFGENRVQDALEKIERLPKDIRWHFIGRLQKNKVPKVVGKFFLIHSVDTLELAEKISQVSEERDLTTSILLQSNTSGEETKSGLSPQEWEEKIGALKLLPNLAIKGLMTMAPLTEDNEEIDKCFHSLQELKSRLEARGLSLPILSMGMTHDYPLAIYRGATLLRIGSALFGI